MHVYNCNNYNCLFSEMAPSKSQKVVPRLKDYHVSEETGFILPEPLVGRGIRLRIFWTR